MYDLGILAVSKNRLFGFEEEEVFRFPSPIRDHAGGWSSGENAHTKDGEVYWRSQSLLLSAQCQSHVTNRWLLSNLSFLVLFGWVVIFP